MNAIREDYDNYKVMADERSLVASMYHALRPKLERFEKTRIATEYKPVNFDEETPRTLWNFKKKTIKIDLAVLVFESSPNHDYYLDDPGNKHQCLAALEFKWGNMVSPKGEDFVKPDRKKLYKMKEYFHAKRGYFCFMSGDDEKYTKDRVGSPVPPPLRGKWYKDYYREAQGFLYHKDDGWRFLLY